MSTTSASTPAPAAVGNITVKVDGQAISVPKTMPDPLTGKPVATTMIQACAAARIDVPDYCYHPKLPIAGNCRMCLVEFGTPAMGPDRKPVMNPDGSVKIAKSPRPAIACATPISPGMEIYTQTPAVVEMRKGVLEFLLINHPLDCPICDQAGECKLQEYSVDYGQSASRFVEDKVHKPKREDLGPRIVLDDERCILCSRCIRFTRDIVGDDALGFINRGSYNTLAAYPGKSFDNNYTLNTVDICPVGALTSKDFRFKMRVWFLKETKSVCTSCATGCNIVIGSRDEKIYRYEPRQNDAVNSCWMCDYGRLNYKWVARPDRLTQVNVIRDGHAEVSAWPTALSEIASRLHSAPPGSVGIIASARLSNEELFLVKKLAEKTGAISDVFPRSGPGDRLLLHSDRNPNMSGAKILGVSPAKPGTNVKAIAEGIAMGTVKTLLVFCEDVTKGGIPKPLLSQLDFLLVSDILPSDTSAAAHIILPGCAHAEKRGTFTNIKGRVQRFWKAVEPPGNARPEIEYLYELVFGAGKNGPAISAPMVFDQMAKEVPAFAGMTWASLGDTGMDVNV